MTYEISLPPHPANLHNVFHVSQLRKYITSLYHVLESDEVQVREDLTMPIGPVRILDAQVKQLRGKEIRTVKVLWDEMTQEMTWEMEDLMRRSYPHLFPGNFRVSSFMARFFSSSSLLILCTTGFVEGSTISR